VVLLNNLGSISVSEQFTRNDYDHLMQHNKFVIDKDVVVCSTCYGNCGQCGVGRHQSDCQDYYDQHPEEFKLVTKLKTMPVPSPMVILMSLAAIAHTFFQ
jgi:hypothetical protein